MKISASFLSIQEPFQENIKKLENTTIDFLHLDIMDGKFVEKETWKKEDLIFLKDSKKPLDVHLMVEDVFSYIDAFSTLHPAFITVHYEAIEDIYLVMDYIHSYGIKAGISIKPDTPLEVLEPFYDLVDLILIMTVEPGMGGQSFIEDMSLKVKKLREKKEKSHYRFLISVDGGMNDKTKENVKETDILVVGSFITKNSDYQNQVNLLKNE